MTWSILYFTILATSSILGIVNFKFLNNSNKAFLLLLLCTIFTEVTAYIIVYVTQKSNFLVYHIFSPLQCAIVFWAYFLDTKKSIFIYAIPVILVTGLVLSLFIQPLPAFNSYFMEIELLLFCVLALNYFRELLKIENEIQLKDYPLFWINSGLLIFAVVNIFVLGAYNFFIKDENLKNPLLNSVFFYCRFVSNCLFYSSFSVAFLVKQNSISK